MPVAERTRARVHSQARNAEEEEGTLGESSEENEPSPEQAQPTEPIPRANNNAGNASPHLMHLRRAPMGPLECDPDVPSAVQLSSGLLIGRGSGLNGLDDANHARLACERVPLMISRRHALFDLTRGSWTVTDLRSRNGTYVNGEPLAPSTPRRIQTGDVVSFGGPTFVNVENCRSVNPFVFRLMSGDGGSFVGRPRFVPIKCGSAEPKNADLKCHICLLALNCPRTLASCGHSFCGDCLHAWLLRSGRCPVCRKCSGEAPLPIALCHAVEAMLRLLEEPSIPADEREERRQRADAVIRYEKHRRDAERSLKQSVHFP